jgi:SCY1-like protein 3
LILLEHFHLYVNSFTKEELVDEILPQLLLGIKDVNDLLCTKTLLCLADLIPLLGAEKVIGKNRRKIFADGRPQQNDVFDQNIPRSITPVMNNLNSSVEILSSSPVDDHVDVSDHSIVKEPAILILLSSSSNYSTKNNDKINSNDDGLIDEDETDNEAWIDNWEHDEKEALAVVESSTVLFESSPVVDFKEKLTIAKPLAAAISRPKIDDNIDDLDIKNKKLTKLQEQAEDFFSEFDMTPTFKKNSNVLLVDKNNSNDEMDKDKSNVIESSRLQMSMIAENDAGAERDDEVGWDDNEWNNEL